MYLQSGYPVQPTKEPRLPLRRASGLPHVGHGPSTSGVAPSAPSAGCGASLLMYVQLGYPEQPTNGPRLPWRVTSGFSQRGHISPVATASLVLRSLMYLHSGNREHPTNSPNFPSRTTRRPISHSGHSSPVSRAGTRTRSIDRSARSRVSANGSYHSRTVGS